MDERAPQTHVVAAFDVDGTLTTRDCVIPFLIRVAGLRRVIVSAFRNPVLLLGVAIGRGDRDRLKQAVVGRLLRGRPADVVEEAGRAFAREDIARWVRPDTLARLRWHRENGHEIVIVSASLRQYLEPLASEFLGGVHALICTEVESSDGGILTGQLVGGNCRGVEKSRRLASWIDGRSVTLYAYGDSSGDREMLAMSHYPVRVRGVTIATAPDHRVHT